MGDQLSVKALRVVVPVRFITIFSCELSGIELASWLGLFGLGSNRAKAPKLFGGFCRCIFWVRLRWLFSMLVLDSSSRDYFANSTSPGYLLIISANLVDMEWIELSSASNLALNLEEVFLQVAELVSYDPCLFRYSFRSPAGAWFCIAVLFDGFTLSVFDMVSSLIGKGTDWSLGIVALVSIFTRSLNLSYFNVWALFGFLLGFQSNIGKSPNVNNNFIWQTITKAWVGPTQLFDKINIYFQGFMYLLK